jgi:hypothetical protein
MAASSGRSPFRKQVPALLVLSLALRSRPSCSASSDIVGSQNELAAMILLVMLVTPVQLLPLVRQRIFGNPG